jgi:hypothetical protein
MNRRIFMLACIAVCLTAALLAGCATTNQLVPAATGPIPANSARIVVSRGSGFVGAAAPIGIIDSGKQIGVVGLNDQISWDRVAGSMELVGFNTLSPPSAERVQPLRVCVGAGMTYQFRVSWPTFSSKWFPDIELVSGAPVACEQSGTISTGKPEQVQQPSTTTTATTDKQMITQNSASIISPSASAISSGNQNILGISVEPTSGVRGVLVKTVSPGSPCDGVLKPGDTIFAFDLIGQGDLRVGSAKINANNFQAEVSKIQPGMTVKMILNLRSIRQVSCAIPANTRPLAPQRQ